MLLACNHANTLYLHVHVYEFLHGKLTCIMYIHVHGTTMYILAQHRVREHVKEKGSITSFSIDIQ